MKKTLALVAVVAAMNSYAQGTWAPYASVEENIHFSDVSPSYNYLNLSLPAGNAGMRMGAFYTHNSQLSAEITLGVVGVGTPGTFKHHHSCRSSWTLQLARWHGCKNSLKIQS